MTSDGEAAAIAWLTPGELRIGLGCMRLSTDPERDEARAFATVHAALAAGVTVFDSARAYGRDDGDRGHNERLLARALAAHPDGAQARVVTKGGMTRPDGAWRPDGRARSIVADCEASLHALDGRPIDLYLLHAPDPRAPFATSMRALASLVERGLVRRVGVSNVSRRELREALALAPISAIEVALGAGDDEALRGGVVELALRRGLWVLAHAPFGGPKRAARLGKDVTLARAAARMGGSAAQAVLRGLVALHPRIVALPGAGTPETARSAAAAAHLPLDDESRALLDERLGTLGPPRPRPASARPSIAAEVVLVAGISGAGKSTHVTRFTDAGYERLNRDQRGGTLAAIVRALEARLAEGAARLVLDNTYVTRRGRYDVLRAAARHGAQVRCVWLDTPLVEAQRNAIGRMLQAHGRLLTPDELARGGDDPTRLSPRALFAQSQQLEAPEPDEGFTSIEVVPFVRHPIVHQENDSLAEGRAVALEALLAHGPALLDVGTPGPRLVFAWLPEGEAPLHGATSELPVERAACTHAGGPPRCWCRPPLPGLLLAFAHRHRLDVARLTVVGVSAAHRRLAEAAGARFVEP